MNFTKSITKHIKKLIGTSKDEESLQEVLKRKFTRKEYKIFLAFEQGQSIDEIKLLIKEDDEEKILKSYQNSIKKLNQEVFKKEIIDL